MALDSAFLAYVVVFGLAAVACFASAVRAHRRIDDPGTRRGITWLLVLSGGWATVHVGFLAVPGTTLKTAFYFGGLVVGLATVGPWLYFCSAYTGRSLHRNRLIRGTAVMVFLIFVAVKLTNPLHGLYLTAELVETPFPHLAVEHGTFHWIAMGLSYALAAVGYFMLIELFLQVDYDTRPFVVLVTVTGLPLVFNLIGRESPLLLDITYEPLGVAVFAVGVFAVYLDRFQAIRLAAGHDDAVIVLDEDGRLRDHNSGAADLFPALTATGDAVGTPLEALLPEIAEAIEAETEVVEIERGDVDGYYRLTTNPFGADSARLGRLVTLTDVTESERYRRELERQNERLDQFANMVSHDLRNPLSVAMGRLDVARDERDSEHLTIVARSLDRMEDLIDDVLTLARQGQPIDEPTSVRLSEIADRCWEVVSSNGADLVVDRELVFRADADRLQRLLENLFRNSIDHGGEEVTVTVGALDDGDGFYVADDGPGIPADDRDEVFTSGFTTDDDGTGFGLAIAQEIVDAHGWTVRVTEATGGGARFEVTGVETDT